MPQLQIVSDPYTPQTSMALSGMVEGFLPNPRADAEAQVLAARMRQANQQQAELAQKMRLEEQKAAQDAEMQRRQLSAADNYASAARRYTLTHQPVAGIPANPDPAEMARLQENRTMAEADYATQAAKVNALRGAVNMQDFGKGLGELNSMNALPMPAPIGTLPGMTREIAANPDARKQYAQTFATDAAKNAAGGPAQIAAANETMIKLQNAENAYRGLKDQGEIGPWAGGAVGRTWDKYGFGNQDAASLREAYQSAANLLQLELGKIYLAGQGAVTQPEREILAQTLPQLNASNADMALQQLQQMRETAQRVIARIQGGGGGGGGAPAPSAPTPSRQPPPEHVQMLLDGLRRGDPTVASEFAEQYGPEALRAALSGGR